MSDEAIGLKLTVDAVEAAQSVGELKSLIRDASSEAIKFKRGSDEFNEFAKVAAEAKQKLVDIKEAMIALEPEKKAKAFATMGMKLAEGFRAATAASALLGDKNKDLEETLVKVEAAAQFAQGLQGLSEFGKAWNMLKVIIMANPIFIIIGVLTAIGVAIYELKDKFAFFGKIAEGVGWIIDKIVEGFHALTDALGLTNSKLDALNSKTAELSKKTAETTKENTEQMIKEYDRRIKAAKAEGKETTALEIEKTAMIESQGKVRLRNLQAQLATTKDMKDKDKEALQKDIKTEINDVLDADNEILSIKKEHNRKMAEEEVKAKKERQKIYDELDKQFQEALKKEAEQKKKDKDKADKDALDALKIDFDEKLKLLAQDSTTSLARKRQLQEQELKLRAEFFKKELDLLKSQGKDVTAIEGEIANNKVTQARMANDLIVHDAEGRKKALIGLEKDTNDGILALGEIFISNAKALSKFKNDLALLDIAVDTAKAISSLSAGAEAVAASAADLSGPAASLFAIEYYASGIVRILANVAKAKGLLTGGGAGMPNISSSSGGGGNTGTGGGMVNIQPVTGTTNLNTDGNGGLQNIKVHVVESEITNVQKNVASINNKAKIQ